jgi:hypothetical protein
MDSYVRVFDAHARQKSDNPTIGLILCSKKNEAVARYMKILPSEAQLAREIERGAAGNRRASRAVDRILKQTR